MYVITYKRAGQRGLFNNDFDGVTGRRKEKKPPVCGTARGTVASGGEGSERKKGSGGSVKLRR